MSLKLTVCTLSLLVAGALFVKPLEAKASVANRIQEKKMALQKELEKSARKVLQQSVAEQKVKIGSQDVKQRFLCEYTEGGMGAVDCFESYVGRAWFAKLDLELSDGRLCEAELQITRMTTIYEIDVVSTCYGSDTEPARAIEKTAYTNETGHLK